MASAAATNALRRNCRKVVCIGRNYTDHIKELNNAKPSAPFFFLKPPTSILLRDSGPVIRPKGAVLHHEVELGLVMGDTIRNVRESEPRQALSAITGYVVGIDITARNLQDEAKKHGRPWTAAKGFDTFLPLSEFIPLDRVPNPDDAELWLDINGESRQRDSTNLMLFKIPTILSHISRVMTLEAGDLVLTGTPKGVGPIRHGDIMTAGLRVNGKDVRESRIEVEVQDSTADW